MLLRLPLALVLALSATTLEAADSGGNYAIWGVGARSCNQFVNSAPDANGRQPFRDFLTGYLTAYNALAGETYNALGQQKLGDAIVWLDDYCDGHRMDSFERAVGQLIITHHEQRQRGAGGQGGGWGRAPQGADGDAQR